MHKFEFRKYYALLPGSWDELTKDDLLFIGQLTCVDMNKEQFNILLLQYFTNISWTEFFEIPAEQLKWVADSCFKFLYKPSELTTQLIATIPTKTKELQGCETQMLNCTFEQFFGHTEPAFSNYAKTNDADWLAYLVAALYSFENDKFNPSAIEENKRLLQKVEPKYLQAVLFFYIGCRDLLINKFPELFQKSKNKKPDDLAYFKMVDSLNNEHLANNEKVKQANLWEALQRLKSMIEKAEKLEELKNR